MFGNKGSSAGSTGSNVEKARGAGNIQKVTEPNYVPRDVNGKELGLPRYDNGKIVNGTSHIPESQFPHSQIGAKGGRNGDMMANLYKEQIGQIMEELTTLIHILIQRF